MNHKIFKNLITLIILVSTNLAFAQEYILPNETLIYSFETPNGKKLVLVKEKKR